MEHLFQMVANGLVIGAIYALMAVGLSLVYGVMRVVNVTHGDLAMLGGYLTYFLWEWARIPPPASLLPVMAVLFGFGVLMERAVIERVVGRPMLASLMLTFGLSAALWNTAEAVFTTKVRGIQYWTAPVSLGPVSMSASYVAGFVLAVVLAAGLFAFLRYSLWGKAVRATSQNPDVATSCGVDTARVRAVAFGVGAALAAAAGNIVAMTSFIFPAMGFLYLAKAFTIVVLGGLGSPTGALAAAILYGLLESVGTQVLSPRVAHGLPFVILVVTLMVRPSGLWGTRWERLAPQA